MISVAEAHALVLAAAPRLGGELVPLAQAAGRVLDEAVCAERENPPFDRVAMDGIALDAVQLAGGRQRFRLAGIQAAGQAPQPHPGGEACLEVLTGAVLPAGAAAVIPVEKILVREGWAELAEGVGAELWDNVHRQGSDHPSGHELLPPGALLRTPQLAAAASAGRAELRVRRLPRAAFVSTGTELVGADTLPLPWQIRRSNGPAVAAELRGRGLEVEEHHLPDDEERIEAELAALLPRRDLLILSGGVSAGRYDFVPAVLARLGCEILFHKIEQRPGKPLLCARRDGCLIFGLPGNPVSAVVCFHRYVLPALAAMQGLPAPQPGRVRLLEELRPPKNLALFQAGCRVETEEGPAFLPRRGNGSGDYGSLAPADGFVELAAGRSHPAGSWVPFYPWNA